MLFHKVALQDSMTTKLVQTCGLVSDITASTNNVLFLTYLRYNATFKVTKFESLFYKN